MAVDLNEQNQTVTYVDINLVRLARGLQYMRVQTTTREKIMTNFKPTIDTFANHAARGGGIKWEIQ